MRRSLCSIIRGRGSVMAVNCRNPKSEVRSPKEGRRPKSEEAAWRCRRVGSWARAARSSDYPKLVFVVRVRFQEPQRRDGRGEKHEAEGTPIDHGSVTWLRLAGISLPLCASRTGGLWRRGLTP